MAGVFVPSAFVAALLRFRWGDHGDLEIHGCEESLGREPPR